MTLWRLSNYVDLNGIGGTITSGRWHRKGIPIAYLADHTALSILETLVHMEVADIDDIPDSYKLTRVDVAAGISIQALDLALLPRGWQDNESVTQTIGMSWLQSSPSALLRVPSAVAPEAWNYLYNPQHPDADGCTPTETIERPWDRRLFKM